MKIQSIRAWLVDHPLDQAWFDLLPDYMFRQTTVILTPEDYVDLAKRISRGDMKLAYDWGYQVGHADGYGQGRDEDRIIRFHESGRPRTVRNNVTHEGWGDGVEYKADLT